MGKGKRFRFNARAFRRPRVAGERRTKSMSTTKEVSLIGSAPHDTLTDAQKDATGKGKREDKPSRPAKETKGHRIILYVPERAYQALVLRAYQRQQRIEQ